MLTVLEKLTFKSYLVHENESTVAETISVINVIPKKLASKIYSETDQNKTDLVHVETSQQNATATFSFETCPLGRRLHHPEELNFKDI